MAQRWIKVPGPGEFRGEGVWMRIEESGWDWDDWRLGQGGPGFLPTREQDEKPDNEEM